MQNQAINELPDLRSLTFKINPSDLGITRETFDGKVWGILMESGDDNWFYSILSLADGTSSLFFSSGGGVFSDKTDNKVKEIGIVYLSLAQTYLQRAIRVESFPGPEKGEVIFYFFTFNGVSSYKTTEAALVEQEDPLSNLFYVAHDLLTELRTKKE